MNITIILLSITQIIQAALIVYLFTKVVEIKCSSDRIDHSFDGLHKLITDLKSIIFSITNLRNKIMLQDDRINKIHKKMENKNAT